VAVTTKVATIDDHPLIRSGIRAALAGSMEFSLVAEGESLHDAIAIAQTHSPDIILLDINIPGNGFEAAKLLGKSYPTIKVVMFTVSERSDHLVFALEHKVIGYVLKGADEEELFRCLRSVKNGKRYISPELAGKVLGGEDVPNPAGEPESSEMNMFTGRENDVAQLLALGRTNKEIGEKLNITEKTVKHHMSVIMEKLNVRNRVEAALLLSRKVSRN
jgi:two-component system, NarL family, nitrate/nitrite response regulator NarL